MGIMFMFAVFVILISGFASTVTTTNPECKTRYDDIINRVSQEDSALSWWPDLDNALWALGKMTLPFTMMFDPCMQGFGWIVLAVLLPMVLAIAYLAVGLIPGVG